MREDYYTAAIDIEGILLYGTCTLFLFQVQNYHIATQPFCVERKK